MRILEFLSATHMNGASVHGLALTGLLAEQGHQVTLLAKQGSWAAQQPVPAGVELIQSDLHLFPWDEVRRLAKLVRDRDIEIIHSHQSRAHNLGIALAWMTGAKTIATAHQRHLQLHWMWHDYVLATTEATRQTHQFYNRVPSRCIETVHCFVDCDRFSPNQKKAREAIRAELNLTDVPLVVGVIGSIDPNKGQLHLVEALPRILQIVPAAKLLLVGAERAEYAAKVRTLAEKLKVSDSIVWAGQRSDIPQVLAAIDVLAIASYEEQLPLVVLEAMASGTPIVATRVGGIAECLTDGETGLLVPSGQAQPLAQAIIRLAVEVDLRADLTRQARAQVLRHFSPQSQVSKIEQVFERVLGKAPAKLRLAA